MGRQENRLRNRRYLNKNKEPSKNSKVLEFAKKPIVIITTIIITFLGGIPGIISIIQFVNQKPDFSFFNSIVLTGVEYSNGPLGNRPFFLISGTVSNNGEKPLFPAVFNAILKNNGKELNLIRGLITKDMNKHNPSTTVKLDYENLSNNDLQKITKISPSDPINGSLLFYIPTSVEDAFNINEDAKIIIICKNLSGKEFRSEFKLDRIVKKPTFFPKSGITVTPDTL